MGLDIAIADEMASRLGFSYDFEPQEFAATLASVQGSDASFGKKELGAMPRASVILLSTLAVTWLLILLYVGREYLKNRKK